MKLHPSRCDGLPTTETHTSNAKGIRRDCSNSNVLGIFACRNRKALQPSPMTWFCHNESLANASVCRSFSVILDLSSSSCIHRKRLGSLAASQNGLAVRPSMCSSEGSCLGPSPMDTRMSPAALFVNLLTRTLSFPFLSQPASISSRPSFTSPQN